MNLSNGGVADVHFTKVLLEVLAEPVHVTLGGFELVPNESTAWLHHRLSDLLQVLPGYLAQVALRSACALGQRVGCVDLRLLGRLNLFFVGGSLQVRPCPGSLSWCRFRFGFALAFCLGFPPLPLPLPQARHLHPANVANPRTVY